MNSKKRTVKVSQPNKGKNRNKSTNLTPKKKKRKK